MGVIEQFTNSKSVPDCFRDAVVKRFNGKLRGLIVPHAGYIYSGSVAAAGYRLMKPGDYNKIIVIGFYHGGPEEHSAKIQIPLIRHILGEEIIIEEKYVDSIVDFKIDDKTLVVASSDLSHYQPLTIANKLDHQTIDAILSRDDTRIRREADACGIWPILTINKLANQFNWRPVLVDYRTSAWATGDGSSVVGYASIAYYEPKR
jgi:predicted class III extradiol MEMO1 family dioxygenase